MLRSATDLHAYDIHATDGKMGTVGTFLFDDATWSIRYLAVDTGNWLSERLVLIDPAAVVSDRAAERAVSLGLTRKEVEDSPGIEADRPVSRQQMSRMHEYFGWPMWWEASAGIQGFGLPVLPPQAEKEIDEAARKAQADADPHLRSTAEIIGYGIEATDGDIGHVEDLIIDDEAWVLRYLVVDTRNWLPGRKVLVALTWAEGIDWTRRSVRLDLDRRTVRGSPEFDPEKPINRALEERLYDYYGRPRYWA